ncbi:hypothetical protein BDV30DRAFT_234293 [Aspergillus minisclerotigenes]|uniref:F-box domain-containing protein n=1 Tax=Aspergillus minisclerotigenes TaxID=656917 RepID=A0A5N6JG94_9EURO|nr:hypothetical protein BDV30DRAFT_234293 [Aspergillus minisclerotigenes]
MDILPNELILLIGKYIEGDIFTKLALSKCSRRLQWLFDPPMVYSSLHISSVGARDFRLIQNLLNRPDLARLVQHAYFLFTWSFRPDTRYMTEPWNPRWDSMIEPIVDDICESEIEKVRWRRELRECCDEAWLGVLLTRLDYLKSITFACGDERGLMNSILKKAALRQRPFSTTAPFPCCRRSPSKFTLCNGLVYLPAVRTIEAIETFEYLSDEMDLISSNFPDLKNYTCPITEIVVSPAYNCRGIRDWVATCTKLERLKIDIGMVLDIPSSYVFDPIDFRRCLDPCKETLKALSIGFDNSYGRFSATYRTLEVRHHLGRDDLPFGSFKELIVLEHLSMRHANLMRLRGVNIRDSYDAAPQCLVDLLPTSLKSLEITDVVQAFILGLISELRLLVRQHTTIIPQFKRIVLHLQERQLELAMFLIDDLKSECERLGVRLMIIGRSI